MREHDAGDARPDLAGLADDLLRGMDGPDDHDANAPAFDADTDHRDCRRRRRGSRRDRT